MRRHIIRHIENMRGKADHHKRRYAFGVSLGVTAVIFVFWIASAHFAPIGEEQVISEKTPIDSLVENVANVFSVFTSSKSKDGEQEKNVQRYETRNGMIEIEGQNYVKEAGRDQSGSE
jgi:hypothetical protein